MSTKISALKVRRAIEQAGLSEDQKRALFMRLVPNSPEGLKLKPEHVDRITETLRRDRKCGVVLTNNGKIIVIGAGGVKFNYFAFEREDVRQKAAEVRALKAESNVFGEPRI